MYYFVIYLVYCFIIKGYLLALLEWSYVIFIYCNIKILTYEDFAQSDVMYAVTGKNIITNTIFF